MSHAPHDNGAYVKGPRVHFSGVGNAYGIDRHLEMPGIPRVGDFVQMLSTSGQELEYRVLTVVWLCDAETDDAYVVIE